ITIDQRQLIFRQPQTPSGRALSFDTGNLVFTLRHEMLISNSLSGCARRRWVVHETLHVTDNQALMRRMDGASRAAPALQRIFINQQWFPINLVQATGQTIHREVAAIFRNLTARAVAARDTRAEYMGVHRDILQNCPEPYVYEVIRGDTLS